MASKKPECEKEIATPEEDEIRYSLNCIYFYLTEGCNMACRHCWIAPKFQDRDRIYPSLDFRLFKRIVTQAKALGLQGVKLTGGEPLLHPWIREIIKYVTRQALPLQGAASGTFSPLHLRFPLRFYRFSPHLTW